MVSEKLIMVEVSFHRPRLKRKRSLVTLEKAASATGGQRAHRVHYGTL